MARQKDNSNIPSDQAVIDQNVPNKQPYWLRLGSVSSIDGEAKTEQVNKDRLFSVPVGTAGARATWLGHATVLAEVDSVIILTDPVFSQRAFMSQWISPKRYTQPGRVRALIMCPFLP